MDGDRREVLNRLAIEQAASHAIILVDLDGNVLDWKGASELLFAYSAEEIVGRPLATLFIPEDVSEHAPEHERSMARTSGDANDDRWQLRKDGASIWADGAMSPLKVGEQIVGYVKILRNRTDLKGQMETLEARLAALDGQSSRKNSFIATLAHDLRNPLLGIRMGIETLEYEAKQEALQAALAKMRSELQFIHRLIDNLLECTHAASGKIELRRETVSFQELISEATGVSRPPPGVVLKPIMPASPIYVDVDRTRMRQVLTNLIENAIKHTRRGSIWLKLTLDGDDATLKVQDTGDGILPEHMPHIFELFTQVAPVGETRGGLGLGLSIVRDIVALHDGTVSAVSDGAGKGSTFVVRIPALNPREP